MKIATLRRVNLSALVAAAPHLRIETPRLVLRRLDPGDVSTAIAHEQDRAIMRWIRDPQPLAAIEERSRALAASWRGQDGEWLAIAIVPRERAAMIGIVVCRVTVAANETMEIGYRLQPDVHRQGFCFEACSALCEFLFTQIAVRKLVAYCVADNEPSWRLMEKLGMTREARFREYTQLGGQWRDEFVYGLLAREWRAAVNSRSQAVPRRSPSPWRE